MISPKLHYDKMSQKSETLEQRANGEAYALKKFHNAIKRDLITTFSKLDAKNNKLLLDLGVGRGGDIYKWLYCNNIDYVMGIDIADVTEAIRRYIKAKEKFPQRKFTAEFMQWSGLGNESLPDDLHMSYDIVTSMFVSQYLFITESSANNFFKNVSLALKVGGYFIGCVPDGHIILSLLNQNAELGYFKSNMLLIKKCWTGETKLFGSGYTYSIKNTITCSTIDEDGPEEYLVNLDVFEKLAAIYNLYPIIKYPQHIDHNFKNQDRFSCFKHFKPNFSNQDLNRISELYVAFVFQKK